MLRFFAILGVGALSGCGATALDFAAEENVTTGSDQLPPLVCSEPVVTTHRDAEASPTTCERMAFPSA